MTTLERRDRRRALKVWQDLQHYGYFDKSVTGPGGRQIIAAALQREREEASVAAAQWFLFSGKNERAKVKRAVSKPGAKASFGAVTAKGKR